MRVIKFLFGFLVVVLVMGVLSGLVLREALLRSSVSQLKEAVKMLKNLEEKGEYASNCLSLGSTPDETGRVFSSQVRFTSSTEYIIEIICNQFPHSPIQVKADALKPLVRKAPGQAGIIFGNELSGVTLSIMGRSAQIFVLEREVVTGGGNTYDFVSQSVGPTATCSGYGYGCCLDGAQKGIGDQLVGATDCPKACFSQCQQRPVVLSFHTLPFFDISSRTLSVKSNESVEFNYVVSDGLASSVVSDQDATSETDSLTGLLSLAESVMSKNAQPVPIQTTKVQLDFGDGNNVSLKELDGSAEHIYMCRSNLCRFQAKVSVTNGFGVEGADSALAKVEILVSP